VFRSSETAWFSLDVCGKTNARALFGSNEAMKQYDYALRFVKEEYIYLYDELIGAKNK
jgi:hypothetical protein